MVVEVVVLVTAGTTPFVGSANGGFTEGALVSPDCRIGGPI